MARAIVGSIIDGGRLFRAGDEDAFSAHMGTRSVSHLIESGTIEGDWSTSSDEVVSDDIGDLRTRDDEDVAQGDGIPLDDEAEAESDATSSDEVVSGSKSGKKSNRSR